MSKQSRTQPVITASEIASDLGPRRNCIRVLIVGVGQHHHIVDVPYCKFELERAPHEPAKWTQGLFSKAEHDRLPPEQTVGLLSNVDIMEILNKKKRKPG